MYVVFDEIQSLHSPQWDLFAGRQRASPDRPSRGERLLTAAREFGCELRKPPDAGMKPLLAVHDTSYLSFLQTAHEQWTALSERSDDVLPHVYGVRYVHRQPTGVLGLAGLYMTGTNCPIGAGTWQAAYASAQSVIEGARLIREGESIVYSLCRPPGHHAYTDLAGGFCYLNNAAIAATELRRQFSRIAIIDVDVHHGNGTQEIFYRRDDIYCLSIHADPTDFFPFYLGYAEERGEGAGLNFNLNLPLPPGTGDLEITGALRRGLASIEAFDPQALVVSLGLDAAATDPLGVFKVSRAGFERLGALLGHLGLPSVLVQEGGYDGSTLGENLIAFLTGFTTAHALGCKKVKPIESVTAGTT